MNYFVLGVILLLLLFLILIVLLVAAGIQLRQHGQKGKLPLFIMVDIVIIVLLSLYMIYYTRPHIVKEDYECYYNSLSPR